MGRRKQTYLFAPPKRSGGGGLGCAVSLAALALALIALALMLNHAANARVVLDEQRLSVMGLDKTYEGFTVLHVSDLHASPLGENAELWRTLLFSKSFHAVVMTGDMVGSGGDYGPMLALIRTLREIKKDVPIYFVGGDDDPPAVVTVANGSPEPLAEWVRAAQQAGATYLDAPVRQQVGKKTVWFVPQMLYDVDSAAMVQSLTRQKAEMEAKGMPYETEGGVAYRALCCRLDAMQRTVEARKAMQAGDLQIAVSHAPLETDYIRSSLEWTDNAQVFSFRSINLLLAGHYCAGQWRLPGVGAVYLRERGWFPGDAGVVGMQRLNSLNQYISAGLGASEDSPFPGRLFNAPGAALIRFTATIR